MKPERWKPIANYQGIYEVSDRGHVRSLDRVDSRGWNRKGRVLKPAPHSTGHLYVCLHKGGIAQTVAVHRLVAVAFLGEAPAGTECCHGDGDPTNNDVDNLRWGTRSENQFDRVRHGTHHAAMRTHCPRRHPLVEPNLVPSKLKHGIRSCLACKRASSNYARTFTQELADLYFERITNCESK